WHTSVRADQREPARAGSVRGSRRGDRGADDPEGARPVWRAPPGVADAPPGHLVRTPRRPPLGQARPARPHSRAALQRGAAAGHRGPFTDEQGPAPAGGRRQEELGSVAAGRYWIRPLRIAIATA